MKTLTTKISGTLLGLTFIAVGALPLSAQEGHAPVSQQDHQTATRARTEHAQIGRLVTLDESAHRLGLVPQTEDMTRSVNSTAASRFFHVDRWTPVRGLGSIMKVGEITPNQTGDLVRITYSVENGHAVAEQVDFLAARQIRITTGTVANVDLQTRSFDVKNVEGEIQHMNLNIGVGGVVDSPDGLMQLADLHEGQRVEVYFTPRPGTTSSSGVAYLIIRTNTPAPMSTRERSAG